MGREWEAYHKGVPGITLDNLLPTKNAAPSTRRIFQVLRPYVSPVAFWIHALGRVHLAEKNCGKEGKTYGVGFFEGCDDLGGLLVCIYIYICMCINIFIYIYISYM